jgi:aryl-phospho-beta-D-glucosidase BglC (GH1 family)
MTPWPRRIAAFLMLLTALTASAQQGTSLAFERAEHLRRGINLSMWYSQTKDFSGQRLDSYTTPADFALIKSLGFDHVRLPIDPEAFIADFTSGSLRPEMIARLDRTVAAITNSGLNVVLDVHPEDSWKSLLFKGDDGPARFFAFWTTFALHYTNTDPERVFFEILNEPTLDDLYRWQGIQARAVAQIRKVAPRHTLIATASQYSKIDTLLAMETIRDENVLYTFHEYDPMWFTHQGANWGTQGWVTLRGVPYPSTPENILPILGQVPDDRVKLEVQRYGWERWDAARLGMEVAAMADWAQRRGVPLYCGEFGVYKAFASPNARATWISDARTAFESKHIGWAMWDYQGSFGLVSKTQQGTVADPAILSALGLKR